MANQEVGLFGSLVMIILCLGLIHWMGAPEREIKRTGQELAAASENIGGKSSGELVVLAKENLVQYKNAAKREKREQAVASLIRLEDCLNELEKQIKEDTR